jgi:quinolinate synthase
MRDTIKRLARKRNAIILAHNYQPPEIQDIADICGDSLELSIWAAETDADVILFCGVHFMAETASILSPDKIVLLPRKDAGCPMADMVSPDALQVRRNQDSALPVVTYVNSSAAVKALSTICCTSANVLDVVESLDVDEILMVPDRNLAQYASTRTAKTIHMWNGYCPVHDRLTPEQVKQAKQTHPEAAFIAHPECRSEVLAMADAVLSTSGMIRYAAASDFTSFIVGTEAGLLYPLQQTVPGKTFYPVAATMQCPDMKKITFADVARSLETLDGQVKVPESIRRPALKAVQRMVNLAREKKVKADRSKRKAQG